MSETGSTNTDLMEAAGKGAPEGLVLMTDHQNKGRGRQGRVWVDEPGSSLLASVLLRPSQEWAGLIPLVTGLSVNGAVKRFSDAQVGLKWPNDVLVVGDRERKLAGILAEARTFDGDLAVVVGFGCNVYWPEATVEEPASVSQNASGAPIDLASIVRPDSRDVLDDRLALLSSILSDMEQWLSRLEDGDRDAVMAEYRQVCLSLGRAVRLDTPGGELSGIVADIDPEGRIVVETRDGPRTIAAADAHHTG